ncbi:SpoVA/SpoVAEb family sporulation membrane protein [Limnochorda pilosa]|uniref:Stage V sporulation protein AEB n=1 Tax=Limnochorda pilosa TaxID=1555112 RepID=A0A0K2SKK6_LIMPI|nr:SpoVA/SpoVAEb family sporulation membrane protein [Limnochorda pilosa]BAS27641.1 stage V sporulation protein AEB [Limnochorda pilosa]
MTYLLAFLVGGGLTALGQVIVDATSLTNAHMMVLFVVGGAVLTGLGLYQPLLEIGGAGAAVPVSNFGYVITQGVLERLRSEGLFGLFSGIFQLAGGVIGASILFGFLAAVLFKPRG